MTGELIRFFLDSNKQTVVAELHIVWHAILNNIGQHPKNGSEALRVGNVPKYLPPYKILCTLPVSTETPE